MIKSKVRKLNRNLSCRGLSDEMSQKPIFEGRERKSDEP